MLNTFWKTIIYLLYICAKLLIHYSYVLNIWEAAEEYGTTHARTPTDNSLSLEDCPIRDSVTFLRFIQHRRDQVACLRRSIFEKNYGTYKKTKPLDIMCVCVCVCVFLLDDKRNIQHETQAP